MEVKRKPILIISLIVLITLVGLFVAGKNLIGLLFTTGFDISIENQTTSSISGLRITYLNATQDVDVPAIESNSRIKLNINPSENFSENSMKLYYFDKTGTRHEETIVGYFEKGYSGKTKVTIKSIDESGLLTVTIEEAF